MWVLAHVLQFQLHLFNNVIPVNRYTYKQTNKEHTPLQISICPAAYSTVYSNKYPLHFVLNQTFRNLAIPKFITF